MRDIDAAWLAGFLDGEGSFMITRQRRGESCYYSAAISASNTDRRLVDRCRALAGGLIVRSPMKNTRWKTAYIWSVKGRLVRPLIGAVLPFLVSKRKQAENLLALRDITRNGSKSGHFGMPVKTAEEVAQRHALYSQVQELNRRGPVIHDDAPLFSEAAQ